MVQENDNAPQSQVFLAFTDGTYYELFTSTSYTISGASDCYTGDLQDVLDYMPDEGERLMKFALKYPAHLHTKSLVWNETEQSQDNEN